MVTQTDLVASLAKLDHTCVFKINGVHFGLVTIPNILQYDYQ